LMKHSSASGISI